MHENKSITFDKVAREALPQDVKDKMKADRESQKKLLVNGDELLRDILFLQRESVMVNGLREQYVRTYCIKSVFKNYGIEYEDPF